VTAPAAAAAAAAAELAEGTGRRKRSTGIERTKTAQGRKWKTD